MTREKLILDYDGTLTDQEGGFRKYSETFQKLFLSEVDIPIDEFLTLRKEIERKVENDPESGWEYNGVVVASSMSDPYVFHTDVYQKISDRIGISRERREDVMGRCYRDAYNGIDIFFKKGAKEFLTNVQNKFDVNVVTNSIKDKAIGELERMGFSGEGVIGDAKKYVVDQGWNEVEGSLQLPGLERPIMLRRQIYGEILKSLNAIPENTTVMGDNYEVDLALPDHLGMNIIHMVNGTAIPHEESYIRSHPKGHVVRNLEEAAEVLMS